MTDKDARAAAARQHRAAAEERKKARGLKRKQDIEAFEKMGPVAKTFAYGFTLLVLAVPVSCTVAAFKEMGRSAEREAANPVETTVGQLCGRTGRGTNADYVVREEGILLTRADSRAEAVRWSTPSSSLSAPLEVGMTVHEQCRDGEWSQVRILSGTDGLQKLRGWVLSAKLRSVPTTPEGKRIYEVGDLKEVSAIRSKDREAVVTILNRIMSGRPECLAVDLQGIEKRPSNYVAPCFTEDEPDYVDFQLADSKNNRDFTPIRPLNQIDAATACQYAAKARSSHPSTFEPGWGHEYKAGSKGMSVVDINFKARNGFNLELSMHATCSFKGDQLTNIEIFEAG